MSEYALIGVQHIEDMETLVHVEHDAHRFRVSATVTPNGMGTLDVTDMEWTCEGVMDVSGFHLPGCGKGHRLDEEERMMLVDELAQEYRNRELKAGAEQAKRAKFLEGTATLKHMLETGSRIEELEKALAAVLEALPDAERVTRVVKVALGERGAS